MKLLPTAAVLATTLLAACGGGGGASSPTTAPTAATAVPRSTALADTPVPAGFGFATSRTLAGLQSGDFVPDPLRFADPGRTYVSIWQIGATAERQQIALLTLKTLQALDARGGLSLQVPSHVAGIAYEVYDQRGAETALNGEILR